MAWSFTDSRIYADERPFKTVGLPASMVPFVTF
jgi:hypothetical protein